MHHRSQNRLAELLSQFTSRADVERGPRSTKRSRRAGHLHSPAHFELLESRQLLTGFLYDSVVTIGDDINTTQVNSLAVDAADNAYITGMFRGTVDFDTNSSLPADADIATSLGDRSSIFVAKYGSNGSLAWVRVMGSDTTGLLKSEQGLNIKVDATGNSYVTGTFYDTAQFGAYALTSIGGMDGFVTKLAPNGDVAWATSWGTTGSDPGNALQVTQDGNVVVVGAAPGVQTIQKYDGADGSFIWGKSYGGSSLGIGAKISEDSAGNLFVTNAFGSTAIDVDPSSATYMIDHGIGAQGTYVLKLTSQADFLWARTFETLASSPYGRNYPTALAADHNGNVVVSGFYANLVDMNSSPTGYFALPQVSSGGFVAKLSADGELDWAVERSTGSADLSIGEDDTIYSLGTSLVVISANGVIQDQALLTDGETVTVRTGAMAASGRIHTAGSFNGTVDFDPGTTHEFRSASATKGFVQTVLPDPNNASLVPTLLFGDSFETGEWNGLWEEDSQNDWFRSTQRSTTGSYSAEVDGSATNATLTISSPIDLSGMQTATLTFDWLIESGFDAGEYLSLDISTNGGSTWIQDVRRLNGNVSAENVWFNETVDLTPYMSSNLKIRFRSTVSASDEDANVDNVRITAIPAGPNVLPVAVAGGPYVMTEGSSVTLNGSASSDSDGTISDYAWDFDGDGQYDDATGVAPYFTTTNSGTYIVGLQVTDNRGGTATTTATITVGNVAPTANAGVDQSSFKGAVVSLSAASSTDPGNDIVSYAWDLNGNGQYTDATGVNATFTSAVAGVFIVSVKVIDADGAVSFDSATITVTEAASTKFYVLNDATTNATYEYAADGTAVENYAINSGNSAPRGAASTAAGTTVWVADKNRKVFVYDTAGGLQGSWSAGTLASNAQVEGLATNGTDVWIVDNRSHKVFRYTSAAGRLSGSQTAASSFSLNTSNTNPKGIVTDGTYLWVVNDSSSDKVFKYTLSGTLLGSWTIDSGNQTPTGLTIDPANGSQSILIVDSGTDRVYEYTDGRSRVSGSQSAGITFALASGNSNPQGIADPPPVGQSTAAPRSSSGTTFSTMAMIASRSSRALTTDRGLRPALQEFTLSTEQDRPSNLVSLPKSKVNRDKLSDFEMPTQRLQMSTVDEIGDLFLLDGVFETIDEGLFAMLDTTC